jgi:hypothetical protein
MEKEKNTQPHVTKNYHFEHVGQYIDYIHTQYVTIDKDAGIQIGEVNNQQPAPQPISTVQYSRFLKRGVNPLKSDDEVQQNFVNAALSGPSALVDYLLSAEGKLHFDISDIKPSFLINTINQECGTKIKLKSYQTAMQRKM